MNEALRAIQRKMTLMAELAHTPVFILGAPRSGTSIVRLILAECLHYSGPYEGHYFSLLARIRDLVEGYKAEVVRCAPNATFLQSIDPQALLKLICSGFAQKCEQKMKGKWCDKTPGPEMVCVAPLLAEVFPEGRFIFMKRRGIENVMSQIRKFDVPFVGACQGWRDTMALWLKVREGLAGRAIEIDQSELEWRPAEAAEKILRHLGVSSISPAIIAGFVRTHDIERTAPPAGKYFTLEQTGWCDEQRTTFRSICGPMMEVYQYSF